MSDTSEPDRKWHGAWMLAGLVVIAILTFGLAILGKGFNVNLMDRLKIAVAADDKYIEVAKLLRGDETANVVEAEALLGSQGFYRIGNEDQPISSAQVVSLLEIKGFHDLGPAGEPIANEKVKRLLASKGYRYIGGSDTLIQDGEVTRALAAKGYYHIGSQELIDAIRRFDLEEFGPDPQLAGVFQARLRTALIDMMGSLDGPFEVETPGVLWGASTDFLGALDDLEKALHQSEQASRFLTEFWLAMANRRSVFGLNRFNAEVQVVGSLADGDLPRILVCDESDYLDGRYVQLYALSEGDDSSMIGFTDPLEAERHISACFKSVPDLSLALAGQPIPLAVNAAAARVIFGEVPAGGDVPGRFHARLSVLPGF